VSPYDPVNAPITRFQPGDEYKGRRILLRSVDESINEDYSKAAATAARMLSGISADSQAGITVNIQVPPQYPPSTSGIEDWLDRQLSALQTAFVLAKPQDLAQAMLYTRTKLGGGDPNAVNVTLGNVST
jgi:hypothetical protein